MALTPVAIARYAAVAGFRGGDLPTAVAVALASSGGWPDRAGGLWGLPGEPGGDPAGNAAKAFDRYRAGGWGMFAGYANTKYLLYMPVALVAVVDPSVVAIAAAPLVEGFKAGVESLLPGSDMLDTARSGLSLLAKAGAWLSNRHNWVRVAQVAVGAGMIFASINIITDQKIVGVIGKTTDAVGKVL